MLTSNRSSASKSSSISYQKAILLNFSIFRYCDYQNVRKYRVTKHCQKQHRVKGTDEDIETMQGADKPSEFVHNVFGL